MKKEKIINDEFQDNYYKQDVEDDISEVITPITELENFQYNIDSYTNSIPVSRLIEDFDKKIIQIPPFQRPYVWNKQKNSTNRHSPSLFIDSILLGLPIPPISICKTPDAKEEGFLIDGKQRILTMSFFKKGKFDDGSKFSLHGDSIHKSWYDKTYETLEPKLQDRFNRAYIPTTYIRQLTTDKPPIKNGPTSMYLLFDRLNSGGYSLLPHEKRGVLGIDNPELLDLCERLYALNEWKIIFPPSITNFTKYPANETLYKEYIFRTVVFSNNYDQYFGNFQKFLDSFMKYPLNLKEKSEILSIEHKVVSLLARVAHNQTKFFRPSSKFNTSLFDAIFVGLYIAIKNNKNITETQFKTCYQKFLLTKLHERQLKRSIADKNDVIERINKAIKIFLGA